MVLLEYLYWHFAIAPRNIWEIAANYAWALWHRFLIPQHMSHLFSPWHRRLPSDLDKPAGIGDRVINFITDFYIRIFAGGVRFSIVLAGLVSEIVSVFFFSLAFLVWVIWPVVLVVAVGKGLILLSHVF